MGNSIKEIRYNLIKFMSLFHRLFTPAFKKDTKDKYNCTKNQIKTVMILGRVEKITPTILGKCMDMEKGSITSLIDSMENLKLVYRKNDLKDKRKTWIQLTEEGKKYYLEQEEAFIERIEKLFVTLSNDEIQELNDSLKSIVKILEKVRNV
jgi:DNA-binding MarR family transcriptional regulator